MRHGLKLPTEIVRSVFVLVLLPLMLSPSANLFTADNGTIEIHRYKSTSFVCSTPSSEYHCPSPHLEKRPGQVKIADGNRTIDLWVKERSRVHVKPGYYEVSGPPEDGCSPEIAEVDRGSKVSIDLFCG